MGKISRDSRTEFGVAVVKEPLVFEPSKFQSTCMFNSQINANSLFKTSAPIKLFDAYM